MQIERYSHQIIQTPIAQLEKLESGKLAALQLLLGA